MTDTGEMAPEQIRWQRRKEGLARAQAALAAAEELSSEQARAVMDDRARRLAQVPEQPPDTHEILELLQFRLGDETVAIETRFVREVYRPGDITPVPSSASFLVGVTNLRGGVLAVLDLREFFGISSECGEEHAKIIVVGLDSPDFGLLVDEVFEVFRLHVSEVREPPGSVSGIGRDCLRGVTENALLVVDGGSLLSDERLYVDEVA
jgi:purine-binding chemotaxis protein CheW